MNSIVDFARRLPVADIEQRVQAMTALMARNRSAVSASPVFIKLKEVAG
jgi:hypothetical protein